MENIVKIIHDFQSTKNVETVVNQVSIFSILIFKFQVQEKIGTTLDKNSLIL